MSKKSESWIQIEWEPTFNQKQQGWVLKQDIETPQNMDSQSPYKWGLAVLKKTAVYISPSSKSRFITQLEHLTPVQILGQHETIWSLSYQKKHGFIWWTDTEKLNVYNVHVPKPKSIFKTSELLKRRLYDMDAHPHNPLMRIASSRGVFLTKDGKRWEQIERFKSTNTPVAFSSKGTLFVGALRSEDYGETFMPILKWDQIALQVIKNIHQVPSSLRILALERAQSKLFMTIHVGHKNNVKLISKDDGLSWEVWHTTPPLQL